MNWNTLLILLTIAMAIFFLGSCSSVPNSEVNKNTNTSVEEDIKKSDEGKKEGNRSGREGSDKDEDNEPLTEVTTSSRALAETDEIIENVLRNNKSEFAKNLPEDFVIPTDFLGKRILIDYGAMLLAKGVEVPKKLVFEKEEEIQEWQKGKGVTHTFKTGQPLCKESGIKVTLQKEALEALIKVTKESKTQAMPRCSFALDKLEFSNINAIDFNNRCKKESDEGCAFDSTKRTYTQTISNWVERVNDTFAIHRYDDKKRIQTFAEEGRMLEQINSILLLESQKEGKCFNAKKDDKLGSILYSAAPPGASQHHSMIAVDLYKDWRRGQHPKIRRWMARHGWYETVYNDRFHFTYLGVKTDKPIEDPDFDTEVRNKLEELGLMLIDGYWLPSGWKKFKCK